MNQGALPPSGGWEESGGSLRRQSVSRGEPEAEPGIPLCSMPAPGPTLIQHIMSKLLLAAAPIETVIKAIKGAAGEGGG